jgi:hypothetical protein
VGTAGALADQAAAIRRAAERAAGRVRPAAAAPAGRSAGRAGRALDAVVPAVEPPATVARAAGPGRVARRDGAGQVEAELRAAARRPSAREVSTATCRGATASREGAARRVQLRARPRAIRSARVMAGSTTTRAWRTWQARTSPIEEAALHPPASSLAVPDSAYTERSIAWPPACRMRATRRGPSRACLSPRAAAPRRRAPVFPGRQGPRASRTHAPSRPAATWRRVAFRYSSSRAAVGISGLLG